MVINNFLALRQHGKENFLIAWLKYVVTGDTQWYVAMGDFETWCRLQRPLLYLQESDSRVITVHLNRLSQGWTVSSDGSGNPMYEAGCDPLVESTPGVWVWINILALIGRELDVPEVELRSYMGALVGKIWAQKLDSVNKALLTTSSGTPLTGFAYNPTRMDLLAVVTDGVGGEVLLNAAGQSVPDDGTYTVRLGI